MSATGKCVISTTNIFPPPFPKQSGRKYFLSATFAKKTDSSDNSTNQQPPIFPFSVPNKITKQSVVAVLGLGFIDAGYSGDWSRIGVISKESEDLLKIAAFVVVPLCLFLIFSFSEKVED
ncbi:hypothetical protein LguiB_024355 [Lonicera macranthoides]